jgi:hypothetical protein
VIAAQADRADRREPQQQRRGRAAEQREPPGRQLRPAVLVAQHVVGGGQGQPGDPGAHELHRDVGAAVQVGVHAQVPDQAEVEGGDPAEGAVEQCQRGELLDPGDTVAEHDRRVALRSELAAEQVRVGAFGAPDDLQAETGR